MFHLFLSSVLGGGDEQLYAPPALPPNESLLVITHEVNGPKGRGDTVTVRKFQASFWNQPKMPSTSNKDLEKSFPICWTSLHYVTLHFAYAEGN
jgi:hypothetical protein